MAGFATKGSIEPILLATEQPAEPLGVAPDHVLFFSIGEALTKVPHARDLFASAGFKRQRADLVSAFSRITGGSLEIAEDKIAAEIAVIVTDGQPSGPELFQSDCDPLGVEKMNRLAAPLVDRLDHEMGIWLIFERIDFQGSAYLNCGKPTAAITEAFKNQPAARFHCGKECSYSYTGPRTILTIVQAAPGFWDSGAHYVREYVAKRRRDGGTAAAVRLHRTPADLWTAGEPKIELFRRGLRTPSLSGSSGDWQISIECPARDAGVRICMAARAPDQHEEQALVELSGPGSTVNRGNRGHDADLYRLPEHAGFKPEELEELTADSCRFAWGSYGRRHKHPSAPPNDEVVPLSGSSTSPGCTVRDRERAAEIVLACGCLLPDDHGNPHHEIIEIAQAHQVNTEALARWAEDQGYAAREDTWFKEPDRINGLSGLLRAIGTSWSGKIAKGKPTFVIGRLQLTVSPPK